MITGTRWTRLALYALVALLSLTVGAVDASSGARWDFGNAHATITVVPDEDLGPTNAVAVEGSGFVPSQVVDITQSSALLGLGAHGPQDVVTVFLASVVADASGHFGPVVVTVNRTFTGTTGGPRPETVTHTCAPTKDCVIYVISEANQVRYAYHHLDFTP